MTDRERALIQSEMLGSLAMGQMLSGNSEWIITLNRARAAYPADPVTDLQSEPQGEQPEFSQDAPRVRGKPPEAGDPGKSDIQAQDAEPPKAVTGLPVCTRRRQGPGRVG